MNYCHRCMRQTKHSRKIGRGTLILALLTGGLWLLTLPLYFPRCKNCGSPASNSSAWMIAIIAILAIATMLTIHYWR